MNKFEREIIIDATREKVWEAIIDDASYREWTDVFSKGSYFRGAWSEGSEIRFLAQDPDGKENGLFSQIVISDHPNHILIKHLGIVTDSQLDTESATAKEWTPSYEEYFIERVEPNQTRFKVAIDLPDGFEEEMLDSWGKALPLLKAISERD